MKDVSPPQRVWTEIDRLTVEVRGLENKIGQLPTASAIAESVKPYLRGDVEAAWALQKAELPNLIPHQPGIDLISAWISSLSPEGCQ